MSYLALKVVHLIAIAALFTALGGICLSTLMGGRSGPLRGLLMALHGIAMVLLLFTGLGLVFHLGMGGGGPMGWMLGKLLLWLLLGGVVVVPARRPAAAKHLLWLLPLVAGLAAWLALYKPF